MVNISSQDWDMVTDSTSNKRSTINKNKQSHFFLALLILLWGLIICFVGYQYSRERQYKVGILNSSLQQLNLHLADELDVVGSPQELYLRNMGRYEGLRITLVDTLGYVIYDSHSTKQHIVKRKINRPEIIDALKFGAGYAIDDHTEDFESDYFYSATYCNSIIIRSALPYTLSLMEVLRVSNTFLFIAIIISILISVIGFITAKLYSRLQKASDDLDREHELKLNEEQEKIRIKRQLTNNINHELKTPICSILGYLDMILHNPTLTPETTESFVRKSYEQAERLRRLLSDLSTITRIDEASSMVECEDVELRHMIEDIVDDVCPQAQQQSINVVTTIERDLHIVGNHSLLYSIFRNLVDNSIAYSGGRSVWISLEGEDNDRYYFVVRDNGIGVEPKHLGYIFERFYRVDKGRSRKLGGTGLGLSIVKNAVIFHGGKIEARLAEKGGLEFHFTLVKSRMVDDSLLSVDSEVAEHENL